MNLQGTDYFRQSQTVDGITVGIYIPSTAHTVSAEDFAAMARYFMRGLETMRSNEASAAAAVQLDGRPLLAMWAPGLLDVVFCTSHKQAAELGKELIAGLHSIESLAQVN